MMIKGIVACNNLLACEPFKSLSVTTGNKNKYTVTIDASNSLEGLKVVYGNKDYPEGATVYVLSSHKSSAWASPDNTVEINGQKVIFVPVSEVKLLETQTFVPDFQRSK